MPLTKVLQASNMTRKCAVVALLPLLILFFVYAELFNSQICQFINSVTQNNQTKVLETRYINTGSIHIDGQQSKVTGQLKSSKFHHVEIKRIDNFDYKSAMRRLNKEKVSADDPRLIELIRNYYIYPPSLKDYNLTHPNTIDPSEGQAPFVDSRLKYKEGGFFVECGGLDGEWASNTLFFERYRGWTGILIEADPINFKHLLAKQRKAYAINACLNTEPYPSTVSFKQARQIGRIAQGGVQGGTTQVQCFPMYSILLAMNQLDVEFFSLDIEGDELKVLQTIPFEKVNIKMMAVEYKHQSTGAAELRRYVEQKGFDTLIQMSKQNNWVNDFIFRQKGMTN